MSQPTSPPTAMRGQINTDDALLDKPSQARPSNSLEGTARVDGRMSTSRHADLSSPSKAQRTLLSLPAEIRLEIYSYLLPPLATPSEGEALHATCRQTKAEIESESAKRVENHLRVRIGPLPKNDPLHPIVYPIPATIEVGRKPSSMVFNLPIPSLEERKFTDSLASPGPDMPPLSDFHSVSLTYRLLDALPAYINEVTLSYGYHERHINIIWCVQVVTRFVDYFLSNRIIVERKDLNLRKFDVILHRDFRTCVY
ncbi:hypothetical protein N0V83_000817 [Neocucurbitaria cava]|uniref:Uncharacterized protein n=1 Tax=Neocucurbitaria cava TaxID=798079 RepID=A0A9W8YKJ8_9PLEO|nr:hypothetical protein N0V83_000817 [Neocucurbitaria cava]